MKNYFHYQILSLILIVLLLNSCITINITKDSKPLIDPGIPIVSQFRNGDTAKGVFYTIILVTALVGAIVFSPATSSSYGQNGQSLFDRRYSDPIYYTCLSTAGTVTFVISPIDSIVSYQYVNKKIIDLNKIEWNLKLGKTKYEVIKEFQDDQIAKKNIAKRKIVNNFKLKLLDGSITNEELAIIEIDPELKELVKNELGYYNINKEKQTKPLE